MKTRELGKTGLEISRIGLGTVEIGLAYGVEDRLPSEKEAEHILKTAVDLGITYFDTGRAYGLAEERIGKSGIGKNEKIIIGTKCAHFLDLDDVPTGEELERKIREEIETSLRMLQRESLQLVQLHGGTKQQLEQGEIISVMQKLKDEGKILHVGIGTRQEEGLLAALETDFFEVIQVAFNIIDQRKMENIIPLADQKNVGVLVRSVLLKGALTQAVKDFPEQMRPLKDLSKKAEEIAEQMDSELPALATRFVLSQDEVSAALIGTFNPDHLSAAVAAEAAGPLKKNVLSKLKTLALTDPNQVDPDKWWNRGIEKQEQSASHIDNSPLSA